MTILWSLIFILSSTGILIILEIAIGILKDYKLYGTKILNLKTQEIGLLICLWENKYTDKTVDFVTCVDKNGKRYNIELDNIRGFEDDFEK